MPVRYRREGLRIVRVPDGRPPSPLPVAMADPVALANRAEELSARLHRFAQSILRDASRYRPLREAEPRSDVTGAEVLRARKLAGRSQRELAAELDYARGMVADVERGRRNVPERLGEWAKQVLLERGDGRP